MMTTAPETLRDRFEDTLLAHKIAPAPELLDALEALADEAAYPAAADLMAAMIGRLDIRQRIVWQRLLGTGGTLDECAQALGVSAPAVSQAEKRLRRRLTKNRLGAAQG